MRCARHTHTLCFGRDVCKMSSKPACRLDVCVCVSTAGPTKPRSITLPTCATACSVYTYIYLLVHRIIQCQCRSPHTHALDHIRAYTRALNGLLLAGNSSARLYLYCNTFTHLCAVKWPAKSVKCALTHAQLAVRRCEPQTGKAPRATQQQQQHQHHKTQSKSEVQHT